MAKKPNIDIHVDCPNCKYDLHVKVWKTRVNEPVPAEFEFTAQVTAERTLPFAVDEATGEVTQEPTDG